MSTVELKIETLGPVIFAQSRRAKRISISIRPFRPVRVAFPPRISRRRAQAFLQENLHWAQKNLDYVRKIEQEHETTLDDTPPIPQTQAKAMLKNRLQALAQQHGFTYNRVAVRNQKTRWGSCSHLNNINLNINLVALTPDLMDYVILHELVHTRIKNHSKKFWAELDRVVGGKGRAKDLDKRLGRHRLGLRR
jgi:predicted metal-dependent hydrolase